MPDGARVAATLSIARFAPHRHPAAIEFPAAGAHAGDRHRSRFGLTKRELDAKNRVHGVAIALRAREIGIEIEPAVAGAGSSTAAA